MIRAVVFGDSFVAAADRGRPGFARLLPILMLWRGTHMGRGGTGFVKVANDGRQPYPTRLAQMLTIRCDVVVIQASGNDASCDVDQVRRIATCFLTKLVEAGKRVYLIGPMWTIDRPEDLPALQQALEAAGATAGVPVLCALDWLKPSLIGDDNEHPTWLGHLVVAFKAAAAIRRARRVG